jgi:beta-lactamase superfamily II metal-dependent hydrolase
VAALVAILVVAAVVGYMFLKPWWDEYRSKRLPPPSGKELQVHVLDVGQGDSILIIAPSGKTTLVDAGEPGDGKIILGAMKRYNVDHIDLFVATHAHADHIGAADEVIKGTKVGMVLYSGVPNTTKNYEDFLKAIDEKGINLQRAEPGQTFDLGDGVVVSVLAPIQPFFTKDELRSGGNEPNANSVVTRLDYGQFSMLLTGDAEAQTEQRILNKGGNVEADILKVGHHGSKYATTEDFIRRGRFKAAIVSAGPDNRYGHPSQDVLDRLKAAGVKLYRTDFQGEISVTTRGGEEYEIKPAREAKEEMWAGRTPLRDDSAKRGFIDFGDLPPPPKPKQANTNSKKATSGR